MKYKIVKDHGERISATVFLGGGRPLVASKEHPNFDAICEALVSGEEDPDKIRDLFDTSIPIARSFTRALKRMARKVTGVEGERLSKKVEVRNGRIYHEGNEVHGVLVDVIVKFYQAGEKDFRPLVMFLERLQENPNAHSREHLYRWIESRNLTITDSGHFLAYKKVYTTSEPGVFKSASSGHGIVDGKPQTGQLKQKIGSVVEMPREDVTFDPNTHCARGLHVGQWGYVNGFSGDTIVEVLIDPVDVVSVPLDHGSEKMRVCRYRLLRVTTARDRKALRKVSVKSSS